MAKEENAVRNTVVWKEVESTIYRPGLWLPFVGGMVFASCGGIAWATIGTSMPPHVMPWVKLFMGAFVLAGIAVLAGAIRSVIFPSHVRHAGPDVLPDVPTEPVLREGSVVHGRLTHELCEDAQGWEFRPAGKVQRSDQRFLAGFGVPFLAGFSALLTWGFHSQLHLAGWPVSAVCGTAVTAACGGSVFLVIGMVMRSGYRRLATLTIPRDGANLQLESADAPALEKADFGEGLKWLFLGDATRQQVSIPRESVVAVQLCPWKVVLAGSGEGSPPMAVQGLIVLAASGSADYCRFPVLLTSDLIGAARLMQGLAQTLQVPYLFCADAAGWKAERERARSRPPLRTGGWQS